MQRDFCSLMIIRKWWHEKINRIRSITCIHEVAEKSQKNIFVQICYFPDFPLPFTKQFGKNTQKFDKMSYRKVKFRNFFVLFIFLYPLFS